MENLFGISLFKTESYNLLFYSIVKVSLLLFVVFVFLQMSKKAIYKVKAFDIAKKYAIFRLLKYVVYVLSLAISFQIIGFDLSALLVGSAALLVGIGLGLQHLFSDFVSGIILLVDSSVKVGDVIELNGLVCTVQEINLRTTTVLTRDDKYIILPNTDLTKNQLINWTLYNIASRFVVSVGVDYSSDVKTVLRLLEQVIVEQKGILTNPVPFVRFEDFGESSLDFSIYFWSEEVFRVENIKSELRVRIFEILKENNIVIPFPQSVIHIDK
jgi:small-conductance mechanosensitive channel